MNNFIGATIDDFHVKAYQHNKIIDICKEDLLGHWSILLFYPADFSFVCPTELEALQSIYENFKAIDTEIYSCSEDTEYVHKAWADASSEIAKIQYPMLADPAGKLARSFGVLDEDSGQTYRGVFIIDPEGVIQSYTINNMAIGRSADEILRTLEAAQFVHEHGDQVCPVNWKPGDQTLKPGVDLIGKL
ncbi:redoxin domain-containing protein [Ligilactobacillus sp. LYQ135]